MARLSLVLTSLILTLDLSPVSAGSPPPPVAPAVDPAEPVKRPDTPKKPVTDTYHGVPVVDEYRWLEDGKDPAVRAWSDAQNAVARAYLDRLPSRDALAKRLKDINDRRSAWHNELQYRGGTLFAITWHPPLEQPYLITLHSADDAKSERPLVDPNRLDDKGATSIDFYEPSVDGKRVAVCISAHGTEDGDVHVYDVATGRELGDVIPKVQRGTAGGSLSWNADGSGFFYTRYPQPGERPAEDERFYQQLYFHKIGTPLSADTYELGKGFSRIAEIRVTSSEDGRYQIAGVENGDGGQFEQYLRDPSGKWTQLSRYADDVKQVRFGRDGQLYLLSYKDAPRGRLLREPLDRPELARAKVVVDQSDVVISDFMPMKSRLYVADLVGGPSQLRVFDLSGKALGMVPIEPVSSLGYLVPLEGDLLLYGNISYVDPPGWFRYDPATGKSTKTALVSTSPVDFSDLEATQELAVSKDGTKVPVSIIRKKGTPLDGNNPTLLTGYGGYRVSMTPFFDPSRRVWFDQGGVLAIASLRGGAEFGEAWHLGGNLLNKQNVFDDFIACAQHLIDRKYTNPSRLAIEGGSNGGLLMGAALTQRPDLFKAVVSRVGIYDMLRVELTPNGEFNVTEYGTVKDPAQFKALYGYSPYHHVKDGTAYPVVLLMTGENDPRVDPMHSRKMTARMQAANPSGRPVLLRTSATTGHGGGTAMSTRIAEKVDAWSFIFEALGVAYRPGS